VADLRRAQEQLRVYRQAVLKKAFEGELTREWREQQTDLPSAEDLLAQIQEERQRYYEQQLVDWEAAVQEWEAEGKVGKKPRKPSKLKTYNNSVRELNLNIPEDWLFEHIGNLSIGVEYGSSAKSKSEGKVPVIRMGNLQDGKIDWNDLKYSNDDDEINKYILKKGDVLFNRTNSPELVGKTAEYKGERPAVFAGYLIRINHLSQLIRSPYLNWFLNSFPAKEYAAFVKTDGVNQSNINGTKLSNYPIPFCSISEQKQIIKEIESRLSICDQVEANIQESLAKAEALRQSILKKAFEGNLLTAAEITACRQEADYEPAAVLLARMKVEQKK
jgi:type I restriction enzyme S subunit